MSEENKLVYRLGRSETVFLHYELIDDDESFTPEFGIELRFAPQVWREILGILVSLELIVRNKSGDKVPALTLRQAFDFPITGWDTLQERHDQIGFPVDFIAILSSVAVGTTRGVLLEKIKGTPHSKVTLPIVDPMKLVPAAEEGTVFVNKLQRPD